MATASARRPGAGRTPNLTDGPITRTLLLFALPTLGSNVLQSLNGSINSVWVGRFLGENALAATSNANLIMFLMFSLGFGFGIAATVLIGQSMGARDIVGARRALGTTFGLFAIMSLVIATLGWVSAPALLRALATPVEAAPYALAYLRIIFLAMPPMFLGLLLSMALRGTGDSVTPLRFMIVSVILDAGLNPFLIRGIGPFPRMGIAGAATATLIANYVVFIGQLIYIYAKDLPIRLRGPELAFIKPDLVLLRAILFKGFPMGLQMLVMTFSGILMIGFVNREGVQVTAAYGVAQQLWTYIQMPAMAIGTAVSTMVAQNIGANRWDRVERITQSGVLTLLAVTSAALAVMLIFDRQAFALFVGWDSPIIPIARHIQLIASSSFLLFGISLTLFATTRANGAVIAPLIIVAFGLVIVRVGLVFVLRPMLGADAVWYSFPLSSFVTTVIAWAYYRYGGWRNAHMTTPPTAAELRDKSAVMMEPAGRDHPTAEG
ncbi:putative MATE family efflux protein [Sphingomonas vulcanisoli]|uniref:MATE family efflux protein n=1 Tax=Sphingomonas vulcanisoli TaxID=1658060 RepID=A0ABX0TPQ5_9SPHN|nr:MATE family efflux transporter [Sphingomonas vulcanisoli]NIJ07523.1 putative MATE family efflux protein [Sphingomonas vulcanisoli]